MDDFAPTIADRARMFSEQVLVEMVDNPRGRVLCPGNGAALEEGDLVRVLGEPSGYFLDVPFFHISRLQPICPRI